jgi:predicted protein tyrosine phosphatase
MTKTNRLRTAASAIFLATHEDVAKDVSGLLNDAADTIDTMQAVCEAAQIFLDVENDGECIVFQRFIDNLKAALEKWRRE